jgi:hypothetical protein
MKATELIKRLQELVEEYGDKYITIPLGRDGYEFAEDATLHWDTQSFMVE